ncbi:PHP domain protein [Nostocoides japonicum T1-X7]|uniref:PHP domain protein n=1 Tax=Nostocoides japonicum T1-X7 TaxID=1194083 RepID=A0A077LZN5_9MICO|nr:PHP domain-containing protein [Tetrasphaera japonica]CCH79468.1 PHP domain protein [Tetrasphaera japonica T1-X7]
MLVDLHTHSTASDGTLSPGEVVRAAAEAGLTTFALTDHDTFRGWDGAVDAAREYGVGLVRGIEISCVDARISIHLLGYLPDPTMPELVAELDRTRTSRTTRMERMVALMAADGIPVTMADVMAQTDEESSTTVGRPHLADALVAKGLAPDRTAAFERFLGRGSPYYVRHYALDAVYAVRLIRAAGGVPVMAHPFAESRGRVVADPVIERLVAAGLAGLEADHPDHTPDQTAHARELAERFDLLVTGSSDFHGAGKPNRLAERTTSPDVLEALLAQATSGLEVVGPAAP